MITPYDEPDDRDEQDEKDEPGHCDQCLRPHPWCRCDEGD